MQEFPNSEDRRKASDVLIAPVRSNRVKRQSGLFLGVQEKGEILEK